MLSRQRFEAVTQLFFDVSGIRLAEHKRPLVVSRLQKLAQENPEELVVIGVNMRESPKEIRDFVAETGVTFPILMNPDDATLLAYRVRGLPLTAVISPDGGLWERIIGPLDPERFSIDKLHYPSNR